MERWGQFHVNVTGIAMTPQKLRLGLSFIVVLSCWFGRVEAQTPAEPEVSQTRHATHEGRILPTLERDRGPIRDISHRNGYCCGQNHNWYGCGGWRAQCTFAFGSCRTFFREPCLPKQPHERVTVAGGGYHP